MHPMPFPERGFTLIEMVTVMAITAIVAAAVAMFIRIPVQGYVDTTRRAELADEANTAVRRISRDLHLALPNSVRVNGAGTAVEFLLMRSGGRYRADVTSGGGGNILDFNNGADSSFDVLGPGVTLAASDSIVVYNLGISGADAYAGDTRRSYSGSAGTLTSVSFGTTGTPFPFASPSNRFQVIEGPVSYVCAGGVLRRYWGYAITAAQVVPPNGNNAILSNDVASCSITYDASAVAKRTGLVTLNLTLTRSGESVNLYHAVHVSNVP
ncbi:MAG: prepilin-type N-terminal cleavage/methylation domain-containing protein [Burkholderiaceae bacterium]|nr:MAG: prepilin-type N-terminal cleavage/methylation domain-containing protein [Burkholderiaceae bacterium]